MKNKKIGFMIIACVLCISTLVFAEVEPRLTINSAKEQIDKSVVINGSIENPVINQQITIMATELTDGVYNESNISYIDQIPYVAADGTFDITFTPNRVLEADKEYVVRMGGTDISQAIYMIIKLNASGEVDYIYGDADNDGVLSATDASIILQYVLNPKSISNIAGDEEDFLERVSITGDGKVSATNASLVLQKVLNGLFKFPVEESEN